MLKKYVDMGLDFLRRQSLWNVLSSCEKWIALAGVIGLYAVMPLVLIAVSIYLGDAMILLGIPVCIIAGYIAEKMLDYVRPTIEHSPTKIVNSGLLDILAVLIGLFAIVVFFASFYFVIETGNFVDFFCDQLFCVAWVYFMFMLLASKQSLNIEVCESAGPAQSLLSIMSLLIKAIYRMTPVLFGGLVLFALFTMMSLFFMNPWLLAHEFQYATMVLGIAAFLPLTAYFGFLFCYFIVDFFVAFFHIADNSEKCSEKEPKAKK